MNHSTVKMDLLVDQIDNRVASIYLQDRNTDMTKNGHDPFDPFKSPMS